RWRRHAKIASPRWLPATPACQCVEYELPGSIERGLLDRGAPRLRSRELAAHRRNRADGPVTPDFVEPRADLPASACMRGSSAEWRCHAVHSRAQPANRRSSSDILSMDASAQCTRICPGRPKERLAAVIAIPEIP